MQFSRQAVADLAVTLALTSHHFHWLLQNFLPELQHSRLVTAMHHTNQDEVESVCRRLNQGCYSQS